MGSYQIETDEAVWTSERLGDILWRGFDAVAEFLDQRALWVLGVFSFFYFIAVLNTIFKTPLWMDEIGAYYVSRLPLPDMLRILHEGADIQPPLFGFLLHPFAMMGNPSLIRVPAMIGVWVMSVSLFFLVSRMRSGLYGLIAMLAPFLTNAKEYAFQARPYGLVLGGTAAALLCWHRLGYPGRRRLKLVGLWLCCSFVVAIHYYGFLILLPIAAGEFCRQRIERREWTVYGVLAVSVLPLVAALPIMRAVKAAGITSLAKIGGHNVTEAYVDFLAPAAVFLCPVLIASLLVRALSRAERRGQRGVDTRLVPDGGMVAVAMFAALPFVGVPIGMVIGAFVSRYVIATIIGLGAGFAILVPPQRRVGAAVLLVIGLGVGGIFASAIWSKGESSVPVPVAALTPDGQPIVYEGAHEFSADHFYAPREIADRMVYLADPTIARQQTGQNTLDCFLLSLGKISDMHVADYRTFVKGHSRFVLVAEQGDAFPWVLGQLTRDGAKIRVIASAAGATVYEVSVS